MLISKHLKKTKKIWNEACQKENCSEFFYWKDGKCLKSRENNNNKKIKIKINK